MARLAALLVVLAAPAANGAGDPPEIARALDAVSRTTRGETEGLLIEGLEAAYRSCLADPAACRDAEAHLSPRAAQLVEEAKAWMPRHGGVRSFSFLRRLQERQIGWPFPTGEAILGRLFAARPLGPCSPPAPEAVERERQALADFAVLRPRGGTLVAGAIEPQEQDDLAYFLAATAAEGPEVQARASRGRPAPSDPALIAMLLAVDRARLDGDLPGEEKATLDFLGALGFPAKSRKLDEYEWGAASRTVPARVRVSRILPRFAEVAEALGHHELAAIGYRDATAGNAECALEFMEAEEEQTKGLIRAEESRAGCAAVVAERLMLFPPDKDFGEDLYGPDRLARAGFDVPRLYRGALVTLHRDSNPAKLEPVLRAAPAPLGPAALKRLADRGPEDWAERVRVVSSSDRLRYGMAPSPLEVAARGVPPQSTRALAVLGKQASDRWHDGCADFAPDPAVTAALLPVARDRARPDRFEAMNVLAENGVTEVRPLLDAAEGEAKRTVASIRAILDRTTKGKRPRFPPNACGSKPTKP